MIDATEEPAFRRLHEAGPTTSAVMNVRTNADTPEDAEHRHRVRRRGHRPVPHRAHVLRHRSEEPLFILRKMILAGVRRPSAARPWTSSAPMSERDIEGIARGHGRAAGDHPPPRSAAARVRAPERGRAGRARRRHSGSTPPNSSRRADELHELNPMLGHRGCPSRRHLSPRSPRCRSAPSSRPPPSCQAEGKKCFPEIMVPVTGAKAELDDQRALAEKVHAEVCDEVRRRDTSSTSSAP